MRKIIRFCQSQFERLIVEIQIDKNVCLYFIVFDLKLCVEFICWLQPIYLYTSRCCRRFHNPIEKIWYAFPGDPFGLLVRLLLLKSIYLQAIYYYSCDPIPNYSLQITNDNAWKRFSRKMMYCLYWMNKLLKFLLKLILNKIYTLFSVKNTRSMYYIFIIMCNTV